MGTTSDEAERYSAILDYRTALDNALDEADRMRLRLPADEQTESLLTALGDHQEQLAGSVAAIQDLLDTQMETIETATGMTCRQLLNAADAAVGAKP